MNTASAHTFFDTIKPEPAMGLPRTELERIKTRILAFFDTYRDDQGLLHPFLQLKADHTERVARECRMLAVALEWSEPAQHAAELLGWLHDVGRFPQFSTHRSFSDAATINHGHCGADVIQEQCFLESVPSDLQAVLIESVRHHNAMTIPESASAELRPWLRLIRDADKLDIFHVVLSAYNKDGFKDLLDMMPNISISMECSEMILREFEQQTCCTMRNVRSIGDFFVLQLSWIYIINYRPAFHQMMERNIPRQLLQDLTPPYHALRVQRAFANYIT